MESRTPGSRLIGRRTDKDNEWPKIDIIPRKRASEGSSSGRAAKRPTERRNLKDDNFVFKFRILLPNGMAVETKMQPASREMPLEMFVDSIKNAFMRQKGSQAQRRRIDWNNRELYLIDVSDNIIRRRVDFRNMSLDKYNILRLHDGSHGENMYENMWDLTPDTELLRELPEEYSFETALADLIDNALQAVWSNNKTERRLVSVEVRENKISIFDSGPGMDDSAENSIVKWGKMGASLHRSSRGQAIGGKPPYLTPFFGMYGYGGPVASMHLGRCALVSSKSKNSRKVYLLHLEREALLNKCSSEQTWRTRGGLRDPYEDEIRKSPSGSFTKVEIFELKERNVDIMHIQYKLKDIYFPYIQCDEGLGRTTTPIDFEVNGTNLAEVEGGEVATTNLHSCNGPEFIVQLHFHFNGKALSVRGQTGAGNFQEANACLKFIYFPIIAGKESIERILECLAESGYVVAENYQSFSRVSIRRLGRLLPDARWDWLPFMRPRPKRQGTNVLKRCCYRVKCFIETDAGFKPTQSKTDLAHHNAFTKALKNFGNSAPERENGVEVQIEISKDGKQLTLSQLEKQYHDWMFQMHERYDDEMDSGEDQPILVVGPSGTKQLGISSDVVRIHKVFRRKGDIWEAGQKIKILKGACAGFHRTNIYAVLEFIILQGFRDDPCGEARLICRPIDVPDEMGCILSVEKGKTSIELRDSVSLPISAIDNGKCIAINDAEWINQLEKRRNSSPSSIDILSAKACQELDVEGSIPAIIHAGHDPPKEIVAVIRPASFTNVKDTKSLDQKYILKTKLEMTLKIKFSSQENDFGDVDHFFTETTMPSSRKEFQGLYIFQLKRILKLFQTAGTYVLMLSVNKPNIKEHQLRVKVLPSEIDCWRLLTSDDTIRSIRVGNSLPPFSIASYDIYNNRVPFTSGLSVKIQFSSEKSILTDVHYLNVNLSSDMLTMVVKNVSMESSELDKIRPSYKCKLTISSLDEVFYVHIPCQVIPGAPQRVIFHPERFGQKLLPGDIIKEFLLEVFDGYGNHVKQNEDFKLLVDGFCIQDRPESVFKVNNRGFLDLSGILKVTKGYGDIVSLSLLSCEKVAFKKEFQIETRELRVASEIPKFCAAGSQLKNIVFEMINPKGEVDEDIHNAEKGGQSHYLSIRSESPGIDDSIRYSFCHGRCKVRAIPVPLAEGMFSFVAAHSRHPEVQVKIEVHVGRGVDIDNGNNKNQCLNGHDLLVLDSTPLLAPKMELEDNSQPAGGAPLLHLDGASSSRNKSITKYMRGYEELEDDVLKYGRILRDHESNLKMLEFKQLKLHDDLSNLQDSLGVSIDVHNGDGYSCDKNLILESIERHDSAAAFICTLLKLPAQERDSDFAEDILGVVAVLGAVETVDLSRILAKFLGEEQMLAVACKSSLSAEALENYEHSAHQDSDCELKKLGKKIGRSIGGHYLVVCVDSIRPYAGKTSGDSQRYLNLPPPTLPNGAIPPGYLGYAVNMIHPDVDFMGWRTKTGHGLRETLFYRLFGELQVYENRECMKMASSCIKEGAVSLDGVIVRGNGLVSLGHWEPDILFPVMSTMQLSPRKVHALNLLEEKRCMLVETRTQILEKKDSYSKDLKKYEESRDKYKKFLDMKKSMVMPKRELDMDSSSSSGC